uniref:BPTI/Kunitz inhibitor domain-containing protein n=1 Tax=Laticauda laticaudata TaxID=8630 RepID=A0A8C5RGT8_LATLA
SPPTPLLPFLLTQILEVSHQPTSPPCPEHLGTCPKMPVLQTLVPCNHTCTDDRQCPPEEKCCYDGCGRSCLPPDRRSRCQLPPEPGPCQVLQPRYFYSPNHGRCRLFFYGGCQGNANNFRSRSECHRVCGGSQISAWLPQSLVQW